MRAREACKRNQRGSPYLGSEPPKNVSNIIPMNSTSFCFGASTEPNTPSGVDNRDATGPAGGRTVEVMIRVAVAVTVDVGMTVTVDVRRDTVWKWT